MRLLFADDDPDLVRSFSELTRRWGYDVIAHATCEEAEEAIEAPGFEPDMALLDMDFRPRTEGGLDLVRLLSKTHPLVPSVVLTGNGSAANAALCMESRAFTYIEKGGDPEKTVRIALRRAVIERLRRYSEELKTRVIDFWAVKGRELVLALAAPESFKEDEKTALLCAYDACACASPVPSPDTLPVPFQALLPLANENATSMPIILGHCGAFNAIVSEWPVELDIAAIERFFIQRFFKGPIEITTHWDNGTDFAYMRLRAIGFALDTLSLARLNGLLRGGVECQTEDVRVTLWARDLTTAGATASASVDGNDTVITIEFLVAWEDANAMARR